MPKFTPDEVLKAAKDEGITLVDLQFTDYLGSLKSVTIPVHKLEGALKDGMWFDGSSVEGFARIHEADMFLLPDAETYSVVPWRAGDGGVARLICDIYKADGTPFEGDPRYILKQAVKEAEKLGYQFNTGPELEFFMYPKDEEGMIEFVSKGNNYYFTEVADESFEIRKSIVEALEEFGIEVEASHYEVAERQHEIDFKYADALTTADNTISFKYTVKSIANLYRYHATFMPKPMAGMNGSGMHTHMSFTDIKTGENAFYDAKDAYNLSPLAHQFVAGVLRHVREIAGVIAPTINSYKRLTPGYEAPVYVCWARKNRSAMIRVPAVRDGVVAATRVELRCPDPSNNPYLAFAAMLRAGIAGIKGKYDKVKPEEHDLFTDTERAQKLVHIPATLGEAVAEMRGSDVLKKTLGATTHERYCEIKQAEWDQFRIAVTDWEVDRYLEDV